MQAMLRHEEVQGRTVEPQLIAILAEAASRVETLEVSERRNVAKLTAGQNPGGRGLTIAGAADRHSAGDARTGKLSRRAPTAWRIRPKSWTRTAGPR